jgi:hypothetical protein
MKNFKCTITPKRLKPTKSGSYPYLVSGPKSMLDFYTEQQGEYLITDDETGKPMYFTKSLYVFGGDIRFVEDAEKQFVPEPNVQSALAVQAMAMNFASLSTPTYSDKTEDADDAELEKPSSKPTGVVKKIGKKS